MKRSNRAPLQVPDDLQHLIEKRAGTERRAKKAKRSTSQPLERRTGRERRSKS